MFFDSGVFCSLSASRLVEGLFSVVVMNTRVRAFNVIFTVQNINPDLVSAVRNISLPTAVTYLMDKRVRER